MLRIIQSRLDKSNLVDQVASNLLDGLLYRTFQLTHGAFQRIFILRLDHIHNCLCLGKIQSAVQESSLGKLSGAGNLGAVFQNRFQNPVHGIDTAVTVNLHGIFSCECFGCAHDHDQNFIHDFFPVINITIMNGVGGHFFNFLFPALGTVNAGYNVHGFRAADSDDSDSRSTHSSRYRCNRCIHVISSM